MTYEPSAISTGATVPPDPTEKKISRGYFYEHRETDGGGVALGYDADAGRGYFQSNPR